MRDLIQGQPHTCADPKLFNKVDYLPYSVPIKLPDGSINRVFKIGSINLTPSITLHDVLYTPSFKLNFMSVHKLSVTANIRFTFCPSHCLMQDLRTESVLAQGRVIGGLYVFNNFSDVANKNISNCKSADLCCNDLAKNEKISDIASGNVTIVNVLI